MKKICVMFLVFSYLFASFAQAGLVDTPDPVEKERAPATESAKDTKKPYDVGDTSDEISKPSAAKTAAKSGGSTWWKWALGILIVGGLAAAGGGGGGDDSSSSGGGSSSGDTGDVTVTW